MSTFLARAGLASLLGLLVHSTTHRVDVSPASTAPADTAPGARLLNDTIPGTGWTEEDWRIFESKVRWARSQGLDKAEVGDAIVRLGATFVGTTYRPGTLEAPGPERLVVNLHELDCVTFVENVLALTRFIRHDGAGLLADPPAARARYEGYLKDLRYRGGVIDGYPSRLHYFSDWLAENERAGRVRRITRELGGRPDSEPIHFMSSHPQSYRQLADSAVLASIRATEERLNAGPPRWYLPKEEIEGVAGKIRNGDVIAATSTLAGLDVAHTGFAMWRDGSLHLIHAPLVGKSVEISELPLAARIRKISTQDGIMVARPLP
jgi:hypothetical protein